MDEQMVQDKVDVQGMCADGFRVVYDVLERQLNNGADIGASAAVFIDGEPVVDIWGGYIDETRTRPWERDTIVNTFSTTKPMTALCALILADRGELDLQAPVTKYWPEYGAAGKGDTKVSHLLAHTSGMPGWTETVTLSDILDREKAADLLARQAPWWEPGTAIGYNLITYGPLIGEVVRRVSGKTLKQFFAEDVAGPLGADYHIGAEPEHDHRVSPLFPGAPPRELGDTQSMTYRAFFNPWISPEIASDIPWRRAELGGSNGHGNARSAAAVQSVLACGGEVRGVRLLSEAGAARALELQAEGNDVITGWQLQWGMGYALGGPTMRHIYGSRFEGRRVAMWGGSGGSWVANDLDARMTVAYVMNRHLESNDVDARSVNVVNAAYDSLAEMS
jgi:CubicO group peptidase (beta-lactamase class C family)